MRRATRWLLVLGGTVALALGIFGVFVPLLPTTPFLLLAAFLYSRSSERFYRWLIGHRFLGGYIQRYREGRSMTRASKAVTLAFLWVTIGLTIGLVLTQLWTELLVAAIAVGMFAPTAALLPGTESDHHLRGHPRMQFPRYWW